MGKYIESELRAAISTSISLGETLIKMGRVPAGGNYQSVKKAIKLFEIDCSHFLGQGYLKGKTHNYGTRPLEAILVLGKVENTWRLKSRLFKEGIKSKKCEECLLEKWLENEIPLELHHKDGNRENNQLSNLSILCPNCHALTDNYRGKNVKV